MSQRKRSSGKDLVVHVLTFLGSAGVTLALIELLPTTHPLLVPLAIVAMLVIGVAVHESGHLLADLLLGFRIIAVSVGPLQIANENGTLRLRRNRDLPLGGMVAAAPKSSANLRKRMLLTVVAGPLASLTAGMAAITLGVMAGKSGGWLLCWGVVSLGLGGLSCIPVRKYYVSDGERARM